MKIEVLIDELQEIIDEAFTLPLSGGKTVVNTERIREIIDDMRSNLPIELKQAKSIAADRTNIINKSKSEAENIVQEAEDRSKTMIQQAEEKANNTIKQAEERQMKWYSRARSFSGRRARQMISLHRLISRLPR